MIAGLSARIATISWTVLPILDVSSRRISTILRVNRHHSFQCFPGNKGPIGKDDTASRPTRYGGLSEIQLPLTTRTPKPSSIATPSLSTMRGYLKHNEHSRVNDYADLGRRYPFIEKIIQTSSWSKPCLIMIYRSAVIAVGTCLKVLGAKILAKEFCCTAKPGGDWVSPYGSIRNDHHCHDCKGEMGSCGLVLFGGGYC
jgi:hypothetical protein